MSTVNSVGNRLKYVMESSGSTAYKLNKSTGISQSTISRILKDEGVPNRSTLLTICDHYNISLDWLTDGIGVKDAVNHVNEASHTYYNDNNIMYVPLVNQYAYAGYLSGYGDPEYVEELPKIPFIADKEYKGEYLCFEAKGDSMDDGTDEAIKERDILLCRNVRKDYWKSKLHINKWDFVIVHKEIGIVTKRIIKHDVENGIITLHSLNDYYEDFDVHLKDVSQILNIVDIQRKKNRR